MNVSVLYSWIISIKMLARK